MNTIDDLIDLLEESKELANRLALVQRQIGLLGAPELAELGGDEDVFVKDGSGALLPSKLNGSTGYGGTNLEGENG